MAQSANPYMAAEGISGNDGIVKRDGDDLASLGAASRNLQGIK